MTGPKLANVDDISKAVYEALYPNDLAKIEGPPKAAYETLKTMGWLRTDVPGPSDDIKDVSSLFTEITPKGDFIQGLIDENKEPANLERIFTFMDLRGGIGQFTTSLIGAAKLGYEQGKKQLRKEVNDNENIKDIRKRLSEIVGLKEYVQKNIIERMNRTLYKVAKTDENGKIIYENDEPKMITVGIVEASPTADTYPDYFPNYLGGGKGGNIAIPLGKVPNLKFTREIHYN